MQVDGNVVGNGGTSVSSMLPVAPGSTYEANAIDQGWWEHR